MWSWISKSSPKRWGFKTFPAEMGLVAGFIKRSYQEVYVSNTFCYRLSALFSIVRTVCINNNNNNSSIKNCLWVLKIAPSLGLKAKSLDFGVGWIRIQIWASYLISLVLVSRSEQQEE